MYIINIFNSDVKPMQLTNWLFDISRTVYVFAIFSKTNE